MNRLILLASGVTTMPILAQVMNGDVNLSRLADFGILGLFCLFMIALWWRERTDRMDAEKRERRILLAMTRYQIPQDEIDQLIQDIQPKAISAVNETSP